MTTKIEPLTKRELGSDFMKYIYQALYDNNINDYGIADKDRCPSVRYLPLFAYYIRGSVIELGCGRAELKKYISNYIGIDWIDYKDVYKADITKDLHLDGFKKESTAICIDVFEHIDDTGLEGLCKNLADCTRQIISVFEGSHVINGVELHINQKTIAQWVSFIDKRFKILEIIYLDSPNRVLFITENYARQH